MPPSPSEARPLESPGLVFLGSLVIAGHLLAVVVAVLAAPSGPWVSAEGNGPAPAPPFAQALYQLLVPRYLEPLKLAHNGRFRSNPPGPPGVYFEVRLKDADGEVTKTLRYPDPEANFWVHHRQTLLVQGLAPDQPMPPPEGEAIAAPGRQAPTVVIWDIAGEMRLRTREVPEHLVPRDRQVFRPTDWSLVLARSYSRHLCRTHGAASAEFIRHTREPLHPALLFMDSPPPDAFAELVANYGEVPRP